MKINSKHIERILATIIHPATGQSILDMGMVKDLVVSDASVSFDLVFTSVNDPLKNSLRKACEQSLRDQIPQLADINVRIKTGLKPVIPVPAEDPLSHVKNIVAIASGKGGVGKSTVAANLAIAFAGSGSKVGLIDADIFGPSIPKMMGVENARPDVTKIDGKDKIIPVERYGIKMLSIGFFIGGNDATVWRGPMASNALRQLIMDAEWGELDYLFVDLPPGTSDIHLTLVQTVPVTGAVIISTPQAVALADAVKGIMMFRNEGINVPVLGLIENMSWFTPEELPENKYYIFGEGGGVKLAREMEIPLLGQIPLIQSVRESGDWGEPAVLKQGQVSHIYKKMAEILRTEIIRRNTNLAPTKKVKIKRKR